MHYGNSSIIKNVVSYTIGFIIVMLLFKALIYVIPAGFIIWAAYKIIQKVKGIIPNKKTYTFKSTKQHDNIEENKKSYVNYDIFNKDNKNIIDVEYEEV